jgi:hypothetical protein
VEFDQLSFTPAVVVFVLAYNVALFEPGVVIVFVLPLLGVVFAWEKADSVMDEKNIAPIIADKINPILKLFFYYLSIWPQVIEILLLSNMQYVLKRWGFCSWHID